MRTAPQTIQRANAGLVIVDIQERLLPAMFEPARLVENVIRLAKGSRVLKLPILVTEQYRKGLGPTIEQVRQLLPDFEPFPKMTFSACGADGFLKAVRQKKVSEAVLCGLESHVCVSQTCLDLLAKGLRVYVVADAVCSRTPENWRIGLERMRDAGAILVSTEMILFELLGKAGIEEFKQVLPLVR